MKENNIFISDNFIKHYLQKFRNLEFTIDTSFLFNISNINITLEQNIPEFNIIPF